MLKREDIEKIERYINRLSDDKEQAWVETFFSRGENNDFLKQYLKKDWDNLLKDPSSKEVDLKYILDRVHHIIRKNEASEEQKPLKRFIRIYSRIAAVLLLPLFIAGGLFCSYLYHHSKILAGQQTTSTINAPLGSRVSFTLPDNTTGMLNSGSRLTYSLPFMDNRHVKLEGEAWFEVTHDKDHPFEINAGNSTVKVLGTSFNISAYPIEKYVEIVLMKGKVEFHSSNDSKVVTMLPSERLVYRNGNIVKTVTEPAKYNAWTEGKLVFRGDRMSEVARRIERWYNVKVNLADNELEKYSFRGTFQDDTLEDVLNFLSLTSPISYTIAPGKTASGGSSQKQEVTIFRKNLTTK